MKLTVARHKTYSTDANQPGMIRDLRKIPAISVANTAMVKDGFPDIVVGRRVSLRWLVNQYGSTFIPYNFLVEIKDENKPKFKQQLTEDEAKFHDDWHGTIDTVTSLGECLRAIGALPQGEY